MLGPIEDALADADELPPSHQAQLQVVHRNGLRLQRPVNGLLEFSRTEAGGIRAVYETTDLAEFTANLANNFRSACKKTGLELRVDCSRLREPVFVGRPRWEEIVLNLLAAGQGGCVGRGLLTRLGKHSVGGSVVGSRIAATSKSLGQADASCRLGKAVGRDTRRSALRQPESCTTRSPPAGAACNCTLPTCNPCVGAQARARARTRCQAPTRSSPQRVPSRYLAGRPRCRARHRRSRSATAFRLPRRPLSRSPAPRAAPNCRRCRAVAQHMLQILNLAAEGEAGWRRHALQGQTALGMHAFGHVPQAEVDRPQHRARSPPAGAAARARPGGRPKGRRE